MNCGIYKITNLENGNCYIGQSINILGRWKSHKYKLNNKTHDNKHLQAAWNLYGSENFIFEVVCYCDPEMLTYYEQSFVDALDPKYNIRKECVDSNKGLEYYPMPEKYKCFPWMLGSAMWNCERAGIKIDLESLNNSIMITIHNVKFIEGILRPVEK